MGSAPASGWFPAYQDLLLLPHLCPIAESHGFSWTVAGVAPWGPGGAADGKGTGADSAARFSPGPAPEVLVSTSESLLWVSDLPFANWKG